MLTPQHDDNDSCSGVMSFVAILLLLAGPVRMPEMMMMMMVVVVMMMMVIDCSDGDTGPVGDVEVGQDVRHLEESNDLYQIFLMKTVLYAHLDLFDLQPSARQQDRVSKAWVSCDELVAEAVL